jgi:hypothetical protein
MLMVSFNPKEFAIVVLLLQDTSFTAAHFVSNVILTLANQHAQQFGISAIITWICVSTIPSAKLPSMSNEWPAIGAPY